MSHALFQTFDLTAPLMEEQAPQNELPPNPAPLEEQQLALVPAAAVTSVELEVVQYRQLPGRGSKMLTMAQDAASRWLPVVKQNGKVVGQKALEASKWALHQIGTATKATHEKGKALAEEWTPVVKAKGAELAAQAKVKGAELAAQAKVKGAELAAQAKVKSKELLSTIAKQSAEMRVKAGKEVALWWNGPPLETDLLECLRNAGESAFAAEVHSELQKLEADTLDVVLFGEFSVGKSSLLNALVGRSLLHEDVVPSTGQITRLVHDTEHKATVKLTDGRQVAIDMAELKEFTTLDEQGVTRADIAEVVIGIDSPLLENGVMLADAPGSFDPGSGQGKAEQIDRTLGAFRNADVVIWVCHAARLLRDSELALTEELVKRHPSVQLIPVINFMGELAEKDRANVRARAARLLNERFSGNLAFLKQHDPSMPPYFEVDARQAQDCPGETTDGFAGLTRLVRNLGANSAIRSAVYQARLKRLQSLLTAIQEQAQPAILQYRSQGEACAAQHGERVREAELWARRFETEAEGVKVSINEEIEDISSTSLSRLIHRELVDQSLKELPEAGNRYGKAQLKQVYDEAADAANVLIGGLASKHGLPAPERIKRGWFAVSFALDVEETTFWNRTLGGRAFRESYVQHFNRQFRHAWNESVAALKEKIHAAWDQSIKTLISHGWHNKVSVFLDGSASNPAFIAIQARELRLRAGTQLSFAERGSSRHPDAQKLLAARTARGERLSEAALNLECLDAALSAVQKSLPTRKRQQGTPDLKQGPPPLPKPEPASTLASHVPPGPLTGGPNPPPLPLPTKPPPLP